LNVTRLIEREFDLPYAQAEGAKRNIAQSRFAEQLVETVMPSVHEFVAQVRLALTYFQQTAKHGDFDRFYLVGGGSRLVGLQKAVTQTLGKSPTDLVSLEHVFVNPKAPVEAIRGELHRLPVAIGAAMQALKVGATQVSFVPYRSAKRAEKTRRRPWVVATLVLLGAVLGVVYGFERWFVRGLEDLSEQTRSVMVRYQANQQALGQYRDNSRIVQEINLLGGLGHDRARIAQILLGAVKHFDAASQAGPFRYRMYALEVKEGKPGEKKESVSGRWYLIRIRGTMKLPRGGDPAQAYDNLDSRLIHAMMNDRLFGKTQCPKATFTDKSATVKAPETDLGRYVRAGDWIRLDADGIWYRVASVGGESELELARPFEGQTMTGNATVCRVECKYFDREQLSFQLDIEVPIPPAPVTVRP
jgi:hypothetical protein